ELHHLNSRDLIERVQQVLRLTPDNLDSLQHYVANFFKSIPLPTIVCISLLDHRYASILVEQPFIYSSSAWIFLTRFNSNEPPVVLLLPIHSTFEGTRKDAEGNNLSSPYTAVNLEADDLEGNDFSSTSEDLKSMIDSTALNVGKKDFFPVDAGLLKALLSGVSSLSSNSPSLAQITSLDCSPKQDGKKSMWDSCLTHSIYEGSESQNIIGKAAEELKNAFQSAALKKNGYYKMCDKEPRKSSRQKKKQFKEEDSTDSRSCESYFPCNLLHDFENSSMMCIQREPVVLVLDANSQVLPWESLPILRKQEVYRMPSVGSILALMISRGHLEMVDLFDEKEKRISKGKNNKTQEVSARKNIQSVALEQASKLPFVDPYNAFYLLNPSGDLSTTQAAFEDWFKNQQGWEGKAGVIPTPEECIFALQKHDLFIYFGHGSGEQYIPERNIKRLDYCAAAVLMGCSSGRLSCRGDYEPVGVPLSYLMAGCPSIIANLWDVTDGDIDRFSKVLLHSWLEAKSRYCSELEVLDELQNLTISSHT
ncbi:hypothetical protein KI387_034956, partial [Taxus chinensis]